MKKNLLMVVQKFYPSGAEALVKSLIPELCEKYNLHIIAMVNNDNANEQNEYINYANRYKVNHYVINEKNHFKRTKQLSRYISSHNIDIIHSHSYFPNMYSRIASIGKKVKKIVTYHSASNDWNDRKLRLVEKVLDHFTDKRIAVSNVPKMHYENCVSKKNKIHVIPNGINIPNKKCHTELDQFRKNNSIDEDELLFLNVGRITTQKNQGMLIELMKALNDSVTFNKKFKLYIIGYKESDLLWNTYQDKIKDYGLQEIITLYGSSNEVNDFMQSADLFLFPSLDEAHPIALIEACSNNLLTIASDINANKNTFNKNEIFFRNSKIVEDWKILIEKIYVQKSYDSKKMIDSAKTKVENLYTIQENAKKYMELYDL